jgi:hypothetical protein
MAISSPQIISPSGPPAAASSTSLQNNRALERKTRPVFVIGCHRSGTNLLYDTLLSAGGFAVYRGYLPIYKMLLPRFGILGKPANRKRMMNAWLRSKGFRRSGLNAEELTVRILDECRSGGDFIRIVMSEIARSQNLARWAVYDPDNLLYIPSMKTDIPDALFIHIIRDGRDVALSLSTMHGFRPLFWERKAKGLTPTALYWEWMVRTGRQYGNRFPSDYIEVRYEELVTETRATLKRLGDFLDHDLDYDRIQNKGLGRLRQSNSSFPDEKNQPCPVNRWRERLSSHELAAIEAVIGEYLEDLGYALSSPQQLRKSGLRAKFARAFYFHMLNTKLWLKTRTPAGRLANLEALELSDSIEPTEVE